jgi:hypothetical protein
MDTSIPLGRQIPSRAPAGLAPRPTRAPAKFSPDALETFARAESARDQGRLEDAARLFGLSAAKWRASGELFLAIDAYFELGAILLLQGRGGLLAELAARLLELSKHDRLPPGGYAKFQIFAALMRKGATDPGVYASLVRELRRHRAMRWELEGADAEPTPGECF